MASVMYVRPIEIVGALNASVHHGHRWFPARADYDAWLNDNAWAAGSIETSPEVAAGVVRHWHGTGQTGCLFARLLGRQATSQEWPTVVSHCDEPGSLGEDEAARLALGLAEAIEDRTVQLVSLVFPRILSVAGVKGLSRALNRHDVISFFEDRSKAGHVRVAGRVDVTGTGVLAWVMAFGPFMEWPPTRRGPVLEFAVRTKRKPERLFAKLNQDPGVAHLADVNLGLDTDHTSRLFDGTGRATRDVLGGEPDVLTAAKTTYSFSIATWDAAPGPALKVGVLPANTRERS